MCAHTPESLTAYGDRPEGASTHSQKTHSRFSSHTPADRGSDRPTLTEMDVFRDMFGEEVVGDMVEDTVKNALGLGDKDKDKKDKGGGILSLFGGDEDKEKEDKGGLFSFGDDKKKDKGKKDEEKGGFFSYFMDEDDDKDEKGKQKKSGFAAFLAEQEGAGAVGENKGETAGSEGNKESEGVNGGDWLDDLMNLSVGTSKGK
ncbi:uncharacterized protein LOC121189309 [Toxotes jaculatrix]|uniref:uncharacterized protein LOC121189309 n=1 Tax=Toxotes jaculatrix TaxID=941984 RepID=UPI001B3AF7F1|nr:uncharacterized protein LOC121189309 [Toxotes jaculatrix]XP_040905200.1 uncharacterized protein LOC121189309 [Toxotes jaculatrix]